MAKTYVQDGDILTLAAPYSVTPGGGAKIGSIIGIALDTTASGATGDFAVEGVFIVPKNSAEAWTVGVLLYWDDTNKVFTITSSGNTKAGVATVAAANPSSTGYCRLNGAF